MGLAQLPTLTARPRMACPKPSSRLQAKAARQTQVRGALEIWRFAVFVRDGYRCRKCGRRVRQTIEHVPEQAQAHHLARRAIQEVRTDMRNGLTLCASPCHELLTGKVAEKWRAIGTRFFRGPSGAKYINADYLVRFERVA